MPSNTPLSLFFSQSILRQSKQLSDRFVSYPHSIPPQKDIMHLRQQAESGMTGTSGEPGLRLEAIRRLTRTSGPASRCPHNLITPDPDAPDGVFNVTRAQERSFILCLDACTPPQLLGKLRPKLAYTYSREISRETDVWG